MPCIQIYICKPVSEVITQGMECNSVSVTRPSSQLVLVIEFSCGCGECNSSCHKPVANCHLQQHQCPGSSYSIDTAEDKLFEINQRNFEMKSDQSSLYSEGISYEEISSGHNYDSYNDQHTVHTCIQWCTSRCDELVIPKHHNSWSLPSDSTHTTTVCRYCREEVKNCHYNKHLVRCSEYLPDYYRINCERCSVRCKKAEKQYSQECEMATELVSGKETQNSGHQFIVNCTAVQASY